MSTIKVVSTQNDVILGQQTTVVEVRVPSSEIRHDKGNRKAKKSVTPAKDVTPNRLHREKETRTVQMDTDLDTDIEATKEKPMESDEYTDSGQITEKHKLRARKKRAIESARRTGREFKEKMQSITSSQNPDDVTDRIDEMLEYSTQRVALSLKASEHQR